MIGRVRRQKRSVALPRMRRAVLLRPGDLTSSLSYSSAVGREEFSLAVITRMWRALPLHPRPTWSQTLAIALLRGWTCCTTCRSHPSECLLYNTHKTGDSISMSGEWKGVVCHATFNTPMLTKSLRQITWRRR